jgi:hypothetical protein
MTQAINDLGGGHSPTEIDASSGAFVNDAAPGFAGNGVPAHSVPGGTPAEVRAPRGLAIWRQRPTTRLGGAGVGLALLALGWLIVKVGAAGRRRRVSRSWFGTRARRR